MAGRESYIYREGNTPETRLVNTQKVKVYAVDADSAGEVQVGVVQTWNPSETKTIEPHRGIGFGDQIAELGVGVTDMTATLSILMLYMRDVMQVLGYKAGVSGSVRSLKHHRWPFDIKEEIIIPSVNKEAAGKTIITIYEGCWLSDYAKAFNIGETAVTQDTTMMITDVYDPLGNVNRAKLDEGLIDIINPVAKSKLFT